jgi:hypothetical protein
MKDMIMAIEVLDEYDGAIFTDGRKWVIDDEERLHIVGDDGNIASYNRAVWRRVRRVEPA